MATELTGYYLYYELATVVSTAITNASALMNNTVNDFGLSYFMYNGELVSVPAYVTEGFYQGGKDQLFNSVTRLSAVEYIVQQALNDLSAKHEAFRKNVVTDVDTMLAAAIGDSRRKMYAFSQLLKKEGTDSPVTLAIKPDFVGQEFYDTTNKKKYEAFGVSAASDWVAMN